MKITKILICGDRNWKDNAVIYDVLSQFSKDTLVITGGAPGADRIANHIAKYGLGMSTWVENAEWGKYGKAAGPIRNRKMLDMKPDKVIAFHPDIENSKGTKNCVLQAQQRNIPVDIIK